MHDDIKTPELLTAVFLSFVIPITVGALMARARMRLFAACGGFVVLLLVSVALLCAPQVGADPSTWLPMYVQGLVEFGCISAVVHVLPAVVAYIATRWIQRCCDARAAAR
ncbi:MAG: hypothetical protein ACKVWV_10830 [Planctomycetota bacterium]